MIGKYGKVLKGKPEEQGDGRNSDRELLRRKAEESHAALDKFSAKNALPLYNQPSDTEQYINNKNQCSTAFPEPKQIPSNELPWCPTVGPERRKKALAIGIGYNKYDGNCLHGYISDWHKSLGRHKLRHSEIAKPSNVFILADAELKGKSSYIIRKLSAHASEPYMTQRHKDSANISFADGHARTTNDPVTEYYGNMIETSAWQ